MEIKQALYERTGIVVAIISLVVAVIGVVYQIRSQKTRELTCDVIQSSELTSVSEVPGLQVDFRYKDKNVVHLWKTVLNLTNTGSDTLIGEGQHNNLIGDGITFSFPSNMEILNIELTGGDFPVAVVQDQVSDFKLRFSQWRTGERVNIAIFVASQTTQTSPLMPMLRSRDIVDGKVVIRNAMVFNQTKLPRLERTPVGMRLVVKVILFIISIFLVAFGLYVIPKEAWKSLQVVLWRKRNMSKFETFVNGLELEAPQKDEIKEDPTLLPEEKWKSFKGKKLQVDPTGRLFISMSSTGPSGLTLFLTFGLGSIVVGATSLVYIVTSILDVYDRLSSYL
jgi:hypothetical protein